MADSNNDEPEVPDTTGVPKGAKPSDEILQLATNVVKALEINDFLERYLGDLYVKLREADTYAETAPGNKDVIFMTASLPITNGIIHIASTRTNVRKAIDVLGTEWQAPAAVPHTDAISVLSALTLIYLVGQGWEDQEAQGWRDKEDRAQWIRILKRIKRWSETE